MIDRAVIEARLAKIRDSAKRLKPLAALPVDVFLKDPDAPLKAERLLEIAAQAMIDIGSHLVAAEGLRKPEEYAEVFTILGEAGVLPRDLAGRLERLAGLRNILVHEYLAVDHHLLHEHLANYLSDFEAFATAIAQILS